MKRYSALDFFRLLCACLVVVIHLGTSNATPIASAIVTCFSRQAVPFFFIVSGFFFSKKLQHENNKNSFVFTYAKHLFLLYGIWTLLHLPSLVINYSNLYNDQSLLYLAAIIIRRIFLAGYSQFWYLLALGETALFCGFLLIKNKKNFLYRIAAVGLCLKILYSAQIDFAAFNLVNKLIYVIFSWDCNALMTGIPFFAIGIFISEKQIPPQLTTIKLFTIYSAVSILSVVCYFFAKANEANPERFLYFYISQAILLFMIGIQWDIPRISSQTSEFFRDISSAIYCLHNLVIEYILGKVIPLSQFFIGKYAFILFICLIVFWIIKRTKISQLYRLVTLR